MWTKAHKSPRDRWPLLCCLCWYRLHTAARCKSCLAAPGEEAHKPSISRTARWGKPLGNKCAAWEKPQEHNTTLPTGSAPQQVYRSLQRDGRGGSTGQRSSPTFTNTPCCPTRPQGEGLPIRSVGTIRSRGGDTKSYLLDQKFENGRHFHSNFVDAIEQFSGHKKRRWHLNRRDFKALQQLKMNE